MRKNICIVLNSKSRKDVYKELGETLSIYKENENCNTECESWLTKDILEKEYEDFKQQFRNLNPKSIQNRLESTGCKDIEEYIQYALENIYNWATLEDYAYNRYNIIRFEEDKTIGLYNPKGYIDYVDSILACGKYKKFTSKDIDRLEISEIILPNETEIKWDFTKDYKSNKLIIKQFINKHIDNNTYIAVARVHF